MVTRVAVNKISLEAHHQLHISSTIKYEITCTGNTDNCSRWVQVCIWHSAWFENWSATVLSKSNITSQIQDAHVHFGQWLGLFGLQPANQCANTVVFVPIARFCISNGEVWIYIFIGTASHQRNIEICRIPFACSLDASCLHFFHMNMTSPLATANVYACNEYRI